MSDTSAVLDEIERKTLKDAEPIGSNKEQDSNDRIGPLSNQETGKNRLLSDSDLAAEIKADLEEKRIASTATFSIDTDKVESGSNGNIDTKEVDPIECPTDQENTPQSAEIIQTSSTDSSAEVPAKEVLLHNKLLKPARTGDEESFEVVEVVGLPCADKKLPVPAETNPLADVTNDELIAILEGDTDSTAEKVVEDRGETIVFEVIDEMNDMPKTLDAEEVKKIAMEQIRNIGPKKRGRPATGAKQDGGALVSSLVSDWSDNEKDLEPSTTAAAGNLAVVAKRSTTPSIKPSTPTKTSPSLKPSPSVKATQSVKTSPPVKLSSVKVPPLPQKVPVAHEKKIVVVKKKSAATAKGTSKLITPTVASLKPSRIIKKKIIWDPDAPETQVSYASFVKPSPGPQKRKLSATASAPPAQKRKIEQPSTIAVNDKRPNSAGQLVETKAKADPAVPVKQKPVKPQLLKAKTVQSAATLPTQLKARTEVKVGRATPSPNALVQNKRKRVSEIDKLLSDEGAANMLNNLEAENPQKDAPRARKTPTPTGPPQAEKVPKKDSTPKKRGRSSASSSWDYVYNQRNVDSLIIRRRSNSSYSSTSPRRLSLEGKARRTSKIKSKSFEFAKPSMKKGGKRSSGSVIETIIADDIKTSSPHEPTERKSVKIPEMKEVTVKLLKSSESLREDKDVTIKRHGNGIVQLIMRPKVDKIRNTFNVQLMNEVVRQLDVLELDNTCRVVVMTSAGLSFCQGVDFLAITQGNAEKKRSAAQELAGSITSFLKALVTFPKPLVAGVNGLCSGIGVTMLPAFDVVIASDKSIFETEYAKIGQLPEGNCILTSTNNVRHSFKVKLLWLCEKLTSTEAALSGLVTKLTAQTKVIDDTLQCAKRIATLSQQSLTSIKAQRFDTKKLMTALNEEQKILVGHWLTPECQEKFKQYIAKEMW